MELALILTAITLGLGTSLHCIGMCGPIAFSLGLSAEKGWEASAKNLLYQLGRVTTYAFLGALVGLVGKGFSLAGFQNYLSIFMGILMVLLVLIPRFQMGQRFVDRYFGHLLIRVKSRLASYLRKRSYPALYITGILNGLLPCGPVYIALAAALATASFFQGIIFMILFGLGTIPLMYATVLFGNVVTASTRQRILRLMPIVTMLVGILFILRGLELGIPYISPPPDTLDINNPACCSGMEN
ncbi:MAG: sulfite exporter TauE/SafE family protein [Weeksellaceae bacterium]|nr:sulfite exporter TauE/SafE family protein [Weeksellaceae bacterium]